MKIRTWIILGLLCFGLTACELPNNADAPLSYAPPSPSTWIDAPLPNATIPLLPYKFVFHGTGVSGVDEFVVQINGEVVGSIPPTGSNSGESGIDTLFMGEYLWAPPAPGFYLITVQAKSQGQESSPARVNVTVIGDVPEQAPEQPLSPTATATATNTSTATATATPEESQECVFTAFTNLFCRIGPGKDYKEIDSFVPDQSAPIVGQSTDEFFWYVLGPNNGVMCTVPKDAQFGEASGDCEGKPRFTPIPPTPTHTPSPTETPKGCTVRQPGGVIQCIVPCPDNASPGEACTPE